MDAIRYRKIVRASAVYDLIVTAAFVTPWTFALVHWLVEYVDTAFVLPGDVPVPDMLTVLLANLLGSVVIVWSLVRVHLGTPVLGRYDALARFLFATWQIFAMGAGLTLAILPLTMMEIAFGVLQILPVRREDKPIVAPR